MKLRLMLDLTFMAEFDRLSSCGVVNRVYPFFRQGQDQAFLRWRIVSRRFFYSEGPAFDAIAQMGSGIWRHS